MTWISAKLSDLGTVVTGATPSTMTSDFYGGEIPFVTPAELDRPHPIVAAAKCLTRSGADQVRAVPPGAVMVSCIGTLGKVGIAGVEVATNQQINSVVFDARQVTPRYGYHACRTLRAKMETMAPSTTLPIVSKSKFEQLTIPVPPLPEQRRIAEILDKADALRAKRRAALAQLETFTQSIFFDMFGDPATNPYGWDIRSLSEIGIEFRYGTSNMSTTDGKWTLRIPNVVGGSIDLHDLKRVQVTSDEFDRLRLQRGDLLFVRTNGNPDYVGRCAIYDPDVVRDEGFDGDDFIFASYLIRGRIPHESMSPVFLREHLATREGRRRLRARSKTSAGQYNINTQGLGSIHVMMPPTELQWAFSRRLHGADTVRRHIKTAAAKLDSLFACLQHRAFRGEL